MDKIEITSVRVGDTIIDSNNESRTVVDFLGDTHKFISNSVALLIKKPGYDPVVEIYCVHERVNIHRSIEARPSGLHALDVVGTGE